MTDRKFILTSGDRDGIGLEISVKALLSVGPRAGTRFLLAAHESARNSVSRKQWAKLARFWNIVEVHGRSLGEALDTFDLTESDELLIFFDSTKNRSAEANWVECAARAALDRRIDGLITGPVSKERFFANDRRDMGHTGLLGRLAKVSVFQGYIGDQCAVVLATDHIELQSVERTLTKSRLLGAYQAARQLRSILPRKRQRNQPIAVLGLNPHAGEDGSIGQFEKTKIRLPAGFSGSFPADSIFHKSQREKFSVFLAMYHDQGLIPFKMLHGQDSGFQISLGLPFIRTSVDHGTAKDIYAKDLANPGSMQDAIRAALRAKF